MFGVSSARAGLVAGFVKGLPQNLKKAQNGASFWYLANLKKIRVEGCRGREGAVLVL